MIISAGIDTKRYTKFDTTVSNLLLRVSSGHRRETQKSLTEKLANNRQNDYNNVPDITKGYLETEMILVVSSKLYL
jgi:hypothetical protein